VPGRDPVGGRSAEARMATLLILLFERAAALDRLPSTLSRRRRMNPQR